MKSASQIDIVPTLSLLLGLPIPFSNLGSIIPFLFSLRSDYYCFDKNTDSELGSALAAAENALQIHSYLKTYNSEFREIDALSISVAEENLKAISYLWKNITSNATQNLEFISKLRTGYREYTKGVYNLFEKKWATFNVEYMIFGIIFLSLALFINILCAEKISNENIIVVLVSIAFIFIHILLYSFFFLYICIPVVFVTGSIFAKMFLSYRSYITECFTSLFTIQFVILFLFFLCSFSNSFIIYEDHVILYLLQSLILYRYYPSIINLVKHNLFSSKAKSSKHNQKLKFEELLVLVCLMLCIRIGSVYFKCREEQIDCANTDFTSSLEKMHKPQSFKIVRLFLSLTSIIIPVVIFLWLSSYKASTKFHTACAVCMRYGIFFVCIFTCLRWWLNVVSPEAVEKILKGNEVLSLFLIEMLFYFFKLKYTFFFL